MFRSILIALDEKGENRSSVERAVKLRADAQAAGSNCELHLLWVDYNKALGDIAQMNASEGEAAQQKYLNHQAQNLQLISQNLTERDIPHKCHQVWEKRRYEAIVKKAHELQCDLVIKEISYQPSIKHLISKPIDWSLLRTCPQPLWLTHAGKDCAQGDVVAAVDPSLDEHNANILNRRIIQLAEKLSQICHQQLSIIHSHSSMSQEVILATGESMFDYRSFTEESKAHHKNTFNALLENFQNTKYEKYLLEGEPEWAIPKHLAEHRASVLVMGTSNKTGLKRALMGSTAESILASIECDILAIKPEGFISPVLS